MWTNFCPTLTTYLPIVDFVDIWRTTYPLTFNKFKKGDCDCLNGFWLSYRIKFWVSKIWNDVVYGCPLRLDDQTGLWYPCPYKSLQTCTVWPLEARRCKYIKVNDQTNFISAQLKIVLCDLLCQKIVQVIEKNFWKVKGQNNFWTAILFLTCYLRLMEI